MEFDSSRSQPCIRPGVRGPRLTHAWARINAEKLAKLQSQARVGGKGTPRRKVKHVVKTAAGESAKLQAALKKLNAQTIPAIEEVNMFKEDGQVIHFKRPQGTRVCMVVDRPDPAVV